MTNSYFSEGLKPPIGIYFVLYPLVICYIAIEHGPVEIVSFPSYKMVIFNSYVSLLEGIYKRYHQHSPVLGFVVQRIPRCGF